MESIYDYLNSDFHSDLTSWEANLKKELKLDSLEGLTTKSTVDGVLPVLTLNPRGHYLNLKESWKKAAQTYLSLSNTTSQDLQRDLESGVRFFVFDLDLTQEDWKKLEQVFLDHEKKEEVEVLILGESSFKASADLHVTFGADLASGRVAHERGGSQVQELALACLEFIEKGDPKADAALYLDSEIFSNIAKLRALRLLLMKVTESWGVRADFRILALSSYRDWSLYERYSNILKNVASVSAGYMGGADLVQSSGFLSLFEKENLSFDVSESERSRALARNSSHILALESMLGVVEDPAFGSAHLEGLTDRFASEAWDLMQRLLPLSKDKRMSEILRLTTEVRETREKEMRKRKHVMAGINDFPDREVLNFKKLPEEKIYRRARSFEELRVRAENLSKKPLVYVSIQGSPAALNARVNFAKNYFQLLGFEVLEGEELSPTRGDILVLVATDDDYEKFKSATFPQERKFLAGKVPLDGFKNIHAGQDVFSVLDEVVKYWEGK